jgi:hypothetical protein
MILVVVCSFCRCSIYFGASCSSSGGRNGLKEDCAHMEEGGDDFRCERGDY